MAGSSDSADNPVGVNVVPLVDIIFCLCVFFMCSFKFRQLEGRFDAWLPKDKGVPKDAIEPIVLPSEMRIAMFWDAANSVVIRKFGVRAIPDDAELARSLAEARDAWRAKGVPDAQLTIDADVHVPWSAVTDVINLAKRCDLAKIEFAMGAAPVRGGVPR